MTRPSTTGHPCRVCRAPAVQVVLDAEPQPISNRFVTDPAVTEYRHPIVLGLCDACGLVQLTESVPVAELVAPYDWVTYNEPEGHLDAVVDVVTALPGLGS